MDVKPGPSTKHRTNTKRSFRKDAEGITKQKKTPKKKKEMYTLHLHNLRP
jgi:hypothetical protein